MKYYLYKVSKVFSSLEVKVYNIKVYNINIILIYKFNIKRNPEILDY